MDPLTSQALTRLAVGVATIVVNLGARHLPASLSPRLLAITTSKHMRILVVFALFFLSTRDPMLSLALACVFFVVISTILHEESRFTWLPSLRTPPTMQAPITITKEVYESAVETVLGFRKQARARAHAQAHANAHVMARPPNLTTAVIRELTRRPAHP